MTTLLAMAFILGGVLVVAGLRLRRDPRIEGALGGLHPVAGGIPTRSGLTAAVARLAGPRLRRQVEALLLSAGRPLADRDRVLASKVLLGAAGGSFGIVAVPVRGVFIVVVPLFLAVAGFRLPDFFLGRAATASRRVMEGGVPAILDLVSLSVAAGLTPRLALDRVAELTQGRLAEELRRAHHEVALGMPWRRALRGVAQRHGLGDLRRLVLTLERSERLGTPVALQLRALAREVRAERRAAEAERARRAPVLMLFPLVFLILPAFVVAAVVPAVLVATRGIS
jgi:tight adherence protein C